MEQLTVVKGHSKCHFCGICKNDYLRYGPLYKLGKIRAHYFCVLLSNRLIQNGNDNEGILGFLLSDIQNELQRTSKILCTYCKKGNATIKCAASKCRKSFHLPCGLKNGSSHQFVYQFKSFCNSHRLAQNIPVKILKEAYKTEVICCICQEKVDVRVKSDVLWAPCCLKTWYHRNCVQKLAHSAGYFCKCPACNDEKKFNEWMQRFGIFIPQQDASWELVPNAFEDLLFRYNNCDAKKCKCPTGRQTNTENTMWELVLCKSCGSQGIHVACGNLKFLDPEWECVECGKITKNVKSSVAEVSDSSKTDEGSSKQSKLSEVGQKKRRRSSEDLKNSVLDKRKKCRTNVDEEEIEIDVETVDEEAKENETLPEAEIKTKDAEEVRTLRQAEEAKSAPKTDAEVFSLIKPGPLSYKLSVVRKFWRELQEPPGKQADRNKKPRSPVTDLIELSDSEQEKEADSDVEVISSLNLNLKVKNDGMNAGEVKSCGKSSRKPSLEDFEVVALVSIHRAEGTEGGGQPPTVNHVPQKVATVSSRNCISLPVYFSQCDGGKVLPSECKCAKASAREDKQLVQVVDDDVVILND